MAGGMFGEFEDGVKIFQMLEKAGKLVSGLAKDEKALTFFRDYSKEISLAHDPRAFKEVVEEAEKAGKLETGTAVKLLDNDVTIAKATKAYGDSQGILNGYVRELKEDFAAGRKSENLESYLVKNKLDTTEAGEIIKGRAAHWDDLARKQATQEISGSGLKGKAQVVDAKLNTGVTGAYNATVNVGAKALDKAGKYGDAILGKREVLKEADGTAKLYEDGTKMTTRNFKRAAGGVAVLTGAALLVAPKVVVGGGEFLVDRVENAFGAVAGTGDGEKKILRNTDGSLLNAQDYTAKWDKLEKTDRDNYLKPDKYTQMWTANQGKSVLTKEAADGQVDFMKPDDYDSYYAQLDKKGQAALLYTDAEYRDQIYPQILEAQEQHRKVLADQEKAKADALAQGSTPPNTDPKTGKPIAGTPVIPAASQGAGTTTAPAPVGKQTLNALLIDAGNKNGKELVDEMKLIKDEANTEGKNLGVLFNIASSFVGGYIMKALGLSEEVQDWAKHLILDSAKGNLVSQGSNMLGAAGNDNQQHTTPRAKEEPKVAPTTSSAQPVFG